VYYARVFNKSKPITIKLSPPEQVDALQQIQSYSNELAKIGNYSFTGTTKPTKAYPLFDDHGIIRVDDRLKNATMSCEQNDYCKFVQIFPRAKCNIF
jgi:hypothetical protein